MCQSQPLPGLRWLFIKYFYFLQVSLYRRQYQQLRLLFQPLFLLFLNDLGQYLRLNLLVLRWYFQLLLHQWMASERSVKFFKKSSGWCLLFVVRDFAACCSELLSLFLWFHLISIISINFFREILLYPFRLAPQWREWKSVLPIVFIFSRIDLMFIAVNSFHNFKVTILSWL